MRHWLRRKLQRSLRSAVCLLEAPQSPKAQEPGASVAKSRRRWATWPRQRERIFIPPPFVLPRLLKGWLRPPTQGELVLLDSVCAHLFQKHINCHIRLSPRREAKSDPWRGLLGCWKGRVKEGTKNIRVSLSVNASYVLRKTLATELLGI